MYVHKRTAQKGNRNLFPLFHAPAGTSPQSEGCPSTRLRSFALLLLVGRGAVEHMDDDDWEVPIPQSKVAPTSTSDHDLLEDRGSE